MRIKTMLAVLACSFITAQFCCGDAYSAVQWIESGRSQIGSGDYGRKISFEGRNRFYEIHVPPCYAGNLTPVVIVFHGGGGNPGAVRYESQMDSISDKYGFIVAYPAGTNPSPLITTKFLYWNDGRQYTDGTYSRINDVGFVSAVLSDLSRLFNVNSKKVYACGISNGALFTYRLAKQLSDKVAAVAAVAGHRGPDELLPYPPRKIPVMQFSGVADAYAPYNGGLPKIKTPWITVFKPVEVVIGEWVKFNSCVLLGTKRVNRATQWDYGSVVLWILEDGGHTWPGGRTYPLLNLGKVNRDINASELMWLFFSKYSF